MKHILFLVSILILIGCSKESNISIEEASEELEVETVLEPGTRTPKGGLIVNQNVLLDKDMNFAYVRVKDYDKSLALSYDQGLSYVPGLIYSKVQEIVFESFKDDFDFIAVLFPEGGAWPSFFLTANCPAEGIGCEINGSYNRRFKGFIAQPGNAGFGGSVTMHEIAHNWGNYGVVPTTSYFHWGYSNIGGFLGGYDEITYLGNKTYLGSFVQDNIFRDNSSTHKYGNLELYLMGLIPSNELKSILVAENPEPIEDELNKFRKFTADTLTMIPPDEFISKWGERLPSFENSQKDFKMLIVLVSDESVIKAEKDEEKSGTLGQYILEFSASGLIEDIESYDTYSFWRATGGRATMEAKISLENLKKPL